MANPEISGSMKALGWTSAAGTALEIFGVLEQGKIARINADRKRVYQQFNQQEAEKKAGQAIAISQREAGEQRRMANIDASRALAVAAASGGGVSDPTIVRLIANVKGEGAYRANVALYEGEARARQLRLAGFTSDFDDRDLVQSGYNLAASATGIKAGLSLYAKYGMGGAGSKASGDAATVAPPTLG